MKLVEPVGSGGSSLPLVTVCVRRIVVCLDISMPLAR